MTKITKTKWNRKMAEKHLKSVSLETAPRTVKFSDILDVNFQLGLGQLMSQNLDVKTSLHLLRIKDVITKHHLEYEAVRKTLLERSGKKDENGALLMTEDKKNYILEDPEAFESEHAALVALPVDVPTIPLTALEGLKLPPNMLHALVKTVVCE